MGNTDSKAGFRKAIQDLKNKDKIIEADNDAFWRQFWKAEQMSFGVDFQLTVQDVFSLVSAEDIRSLREDAPQNLATLAYKAIDQIRQCTEGAHPCSTPNQQQTVLNCVRLLTRLVPFFLEEPDWRSFFWSQLPQPGAAASKQTPLSHFPSSPLAHHSPEPLTPPPTGTTGRFGLYDGPVLATTLMNSLSTLLFCPGFTVNQHKKVTEEAEDLSSLDSCEYIWAAGVGFAIAPPHNAAYDAARIDILRLLLACFSEPMYAAPTSEGAVGPNRWVEYVTSADNRQVLPLFTSLLNVVFAYDPVGYGLPYNYLMFGDSKEPLAEAALQVLVVCLDHVGRVATGREPRSGSQEQVPLEPDTESDMMRNLFINYLSRIHREEDLTFMTAGFVRLLNNPLQSGYLPSSTKKIHLQAELLVLFWKCCEYNRRFLYHVLKSCVVLDILIPILHSLSQSRLNPSKIGLIHLSVFILLLLSGERNFGVRLNKPYTGRAQLPDVPAFTGNYADLIVLVFHRMITSGHAKLQPLFDCLLTIIQNISPYVKSLAMISASKLLHLFEAFSTPWFLYANPRNHQLVFFLMETLNNLIQYQFDGNAPLVYCIIRKRALFHQLASLPCDAAFIDRTVSRGRKPRRSSVTSLPETAEGEADASEPATAEEASPTPAWHTSLPQIPGVGKITGRASGHNLEGFTEEGAARAGKERPSVSGTEAVGGSDALEDGPAVDAVFEASATGASRATPPSRSATNMSFNLQTVPVEPSGGGRNSGTLGGGSALSRSLSLASTGTTTRSQGWTPTPDWIRSWKQRLPMQTVLRLLQVLVPQVEKICIDKNITDESEIVAFLRSGTLVGLLPVPHPLLIRRYRSNAYTSAWVRTYLWGLLYLRNTNPAIWFDTKVSLFAIESG